jgi:hypothetical protein
MVFPRRISGKVDHAPGIPPPYANSRARVTKSQFRPWVQRA